MSYIPGEWWVLCDACQLTARASEVSIRPRDGLLVHTDPSRGCWETKHPQEFLRVRKDPAGPLPYVRPDNDGIDGGTFIVDGQGQANTYDGNFTVHSIIENADWATVPSGTFESTDYDWD